jgi:signal transduction histidine kinase
MSTFFPSNLKSPAKRIFTLVILAFLGLTIYFISQHYFSAVREVKMITLENLHNLSKTIARQIDGDAHEQLMRTNKSKDAIKTKNENPIYDKIHKVLQENLIAANHESPIYTFVFDSVSNALSFGVTSSEQPYFRHKYATPPAGLLENIENGGKLNTYEDEFGSWLSAFTPIRNSQGKVVALLQVDKKFDTFIAQIKRITYQNIILSLVIFSVFIFLLLKFLQRILKDEQLAKESLAEAYFYKKEMSDKLIESEAQLKTYAAQLEVSNKELVDFANIASHDLRAPIRGIASFVQLFERRNKDKLDAQDLEYFNFIKTNTNQSLQLIESLLNYSKVDKNIGEPIAMSVEIAVEKAKNNLLSVLEERNAYLEVGEMPTIQAHPLLIMQLFQNLINNGIKYNKSEKPTVCISVSFSENQECIYAVKDNGIGIEEKFQRDIFSMFRRLHSAGEYEGSGIGLAFCKRIVQTYEGEIWIESEVGKGSTFYFTLPKARVILSKNALKAA